MQKKAVLTLCIDANCCWENKKSLEVHPFQSACIKVSCHFSWLSVRTMRLFKSDCVQRNLSSYLNISQSHQSKRKHVMRLFSSSFFVISSHPHSFTLPRFGRWINQSSFLLQNRGSPMKILFHVFESSFFLFVLTVIQNCLMKLINLIYYNPLNVR